MAERHTIGDVEYSEVAEQNDGGGGYEWSTVTLLRRVDDGQLFLLEQGGCSCNSPWGDWVATDELEPVATWQEAIDRLKANKPSLFTEDDVAAFAEQLMELRPASSRQAARP
jgi:hypothetical protein